MALIIAEGKAYVLVPQDDDDARLKAAHRDAMQTPDILILGEKEACMDISCFWRYRQIRHLHALQMRLQG